MNEYLSPAVQAVLRDAILDAGGNEVFCLGRTDDRQCVREVEVLARGNRHAAPAILQVCRHGDVVIHNHPGGGIEPSGQDLLIAGQLGALGVGFYIVDNQVKRLYRVVEAFAPPSRIHLAPAEIAAYFTPDGPIDQALAGYEERPEQLRMALAVAECFNQDAVALIEAGTGTGKSLAYLVPAVLRALAAKERVVISTNTINLQDQLIRKDIPFLQRASGLEFTAELVKGRSNYLCRRRLGAALAEPGLFDQEQTGELASIHSWAEQTGEGSREDLSFVPRDALWSEVCAEADQCSRARCDFFQSCFFHQARRRAAHADLLVVNHALLLADLNLRKTTDNYSTVAVLPPFSRLIIDEAHHLEEIATRYFSAQVTRFVFARVLNRLRPPRRPERGLLARLINQLGRELPDSSDLVYRSLNQQAEALATASMTLLERAVADLEQAGTNLAESLGRKISAREEIRQRLIETVSASPAWQETAKNLRALARTTAEFAADLESLLKELKKLPDEIEQKIGSTVTDLGGIFSRLALLSETLFACTAKDPDRCNWFEISHGRIGGGEGIITRFYTAPLDVSALLRETLVDRMQSVVMTSATLTVAGRFDFLRRRTGLTEMTERRLHELLLESPFDFDRQALLAIPTDIPEPGRPGFAEAIGPLTERALLAADGRSFVLFTAYSLLRRIHAELEPALTARGFRVLRQGETTRHRLLEQFSSDPTSILFATDSFWEGVDVPGRSLEQVIIARLPFRVPTEPVLEARAEAIQQQGGDPFMEYTVPLAVIRFRQGFGRLIRNRTDRGVVLILDNRVIRRGYGRLFLRSLPEVPVVRLPGCELPGAIRDFFAAAPALQTND
ncbi:MAG TPA: helicase C-terminal domain-containing protein [Desulfuromonadales bacterium]|nr:helicase C-terminal domain-containing protein [Desulfuromonadales bacterium]